MAFNFFVPQVVRDDDDEDEQEPSTFELFQQLGELPPLPERPPERVEASSTLLRGVTDASRSAARELAPSRQPQQTGQDLPDPERAQQLRRLVDSLESALAQGSGDFFSDEYNQETQERLQAARAELRQLEQARQGPNQEDSGLRLERLPEESEDGGFFSALREIVAQGQQAQEAQPQPQTGTEFSPESFRDEPNSFSKSLSLGLRQAKEILAIGGATIMSSLAPVISRVRSEDLLRRGPEILERHIPEGIETEEAIRQYTEGLRREHSERLAQLGQQADPQNFFDEAALITAQSLGFTALAGAGGLAGGLPGSMAAVYAPLKGLLQTDLEEEGLDEDEARLWASGAAIPMALAEGFFEAGAVGRMVERVGGARVVKPGLRRGFAKRIAQFAREVGTGTIVESLTEGLQENVQFLTEFAAVGNVPTLDEYLSVTGQAMRAGAIAGTSFGGGFGLVGEAAQTRQENIATAQAERIRAYARNFNPQDVDPGTVVAGKRADRGPGDRVVWRDPQTSQFTSPPTREEIETHLLGEETAARMEAAAEEATEDVEAIEVPVSEAAERLSRLSSTDRDPATVGLNIREVASGYIGVAKRTLRNRTSSEIDREMAELEALALDPNSDTDFGTRVTAMGRLQALVNERRRPDADAATMLDVTVAARELANLDGNTFAANAADLEQRNDEVSDQLLREARALRETSGDREASQANRVLRHLRQASVRRARGLAPDSRVVREDGVPGTVVNVRKSGFPEVIWDNAGPDARAEPVNPDRLGVLPEPGQMVEVTSGEILTVQQVTDGEIRATLPDGTDTLIQPSEVEQVSGRESTQQDMESRREAQQLAETAVDAEQRAPVVTPTEAVHAFTGQRLQVASVGAETIELTDGTVVDRSDITFGSDMSTTEAIRQTGEIPIFEPGTQPSEEGRHVNFLQVPENYVPILEAAARSNDPNLLGQLIHDLSGTGASLHLLPQPTRPGTRLYALELPGTARDLTDASKRLLGALSGNVNMDKIHPATLMSRVRTNRPLAGDEMRLMRVPEGVRAAVLQPSAISKMDDDAAQTYLRRLTDLSFDMEPAVAEKITETAQAAQTARDAQIDGNPGEAEAAEIHAKVARAETTIEATRSEVATKLELWDAIVEELNSGLAPRERTLVDALNGSTAEDLELSLPGVGPTLAERIAEAAEEGQLEHAEDLLEVQGLGQATYDRIINEFERGNWNPRTPISDVREERLKQFLADLPGRQGRDASNWVLAYEHPQIPGMVMTIDKEVIPTPVEVRGRRFQGERAVYHITFVTPDGTQVRARTIGTEERKVRIPKHLTRPRPGETTARALQEINEGLENGRDFDEIIEDMRSRRREITEVQLGESTYEVLDDDGETAMIEGADGEVVQLPLSQVQTDATTSPEPLVTMQLPAIKLNPDQVRAEVLREARQFNTKAKIVATGEWRAQAPGVYAQVRDSREGVQVAILQEPYEATLRKPRLHEVRSIQRFDSRAEAESWLRDNGYQRPPSIMRFAEDFQEMPPVDEIPQQLPEPEEGETLDDQQWDMLSVDRRLADILEYYDSKGFVPQPVRDYAVRFALRYGQVMRDPVFTPRARRAVNIFTSAELGPTHPDTRGRFGSVPNRSFEAQRVVEGHRDFTLKNGNVVVNKRALAERGDNTRVLDGIIIDPYVEGSHPAKQRAAVDLFQRHEHNQRFMDMADIDGDISIRTLQERLVEIGDDRRLGAIVDAQLGKETVKVQIFEGGESSIATVHKGDVIRIRDPRKLLDYQRAARDSMGEMTNMPKTPEMGASPIDAKFGLDLVQDRAAYIKGLRDRIGEMLRHVTRDENGTIGIEDQNVLFNLADAWIRMKELGIPNRVHHPELENVQSNFATKYNDVVMRAQQGSQIEDDTPLIPPALITTPKRDGMGVILDIAFDRVAGQFSNVSPYGDVMAKAKLDLLTRKQRKNIDKQAEIYGIDPELPTYRKVEELMQNVWDPNTAHMLYQMRRDIGAVGFLQDALKTGNLKHGLEIRMPAVGSTIQMNWFTKNLMTPREAGYRHPTARTFHYLSEKYRTQHGNDVKRYADIIMGLQGMEKMTKERKEAIWSLLQDEELGDWMRNPSVVPSREEVLENASEEAKKPLNDDWKWYQQYRRMREVAVELRSENIRNALIRGFHPEEIDFEDASPEGIGERIGILKIDGDLSQEEATQVQELALQGEKVYNLDRTSNAAYARPRDEVEAFIKHINNYANLESVPNNVREDMADWMVDEFDFWARYGINNYAPKIIQGRHAIKQVMEDGTEVLRAFAPDGQTAQEFFFRVQRGEVEGVPHDAQLVMELRRGVADDLDMQFLGAKRFSTFYAKMAQVVGSEQGSELARTAAQELRLGKEPAAPRDIHTQARVADLSDIIEDPYERMLIYAARTSRNNFLLNIEHAFETARSLDPSLSRAHGVDAIWKSQRFAESGHEVMQKYLLELRDSYMGKAGSWERAFNVIIGAVDTVARMPNRLKNQLLGKIGVKNYSLWNDPTFVEALYNQDYSARRWAEHLTSIQSLLRLGLNFSGAAINATQHFAFGPSYYMSQGASAAESHKFMSQGYSDMLSMWKEKTDPENPTAKQTFLRDVGVATVPARGIAGPGLGITGQGKPINFEGKGLISHGMDLVNYYGMMPFSKAETSVRVSTALAARRMALDRGMSRDAAVQFARDAIDNTQFQYYDQALPPFMRGSVARVLFQFQQFPVNALKWEKDLMMATFGRGKGRFANMSKAEAAKAWAMFNATGLTLGGANWFASRPLFSGILGWLTWQLTKSLGGEGDDPQDLQSVIANTELFGQGGAEWRESKYVGTTVGDPELFRARDFVLYGAPGLLGWNLSARLGVSGLDIDPTRLTDLLFGPTSALHADSWNALIGEEGYKNIRPDTWMGASVGALVGLAAGRNLTAATLGGLIGTAAITELLSLRDGPGVDFRDWTNDHESGRQFMRSVLPNIIEGAEFTYDVFNENFVYDANLQRAEYPGQMNKLFESASRIMGFQTIRSSEQRAVLQNRYRSQIRDRRRRQHFGRMLARAANRGDREAVETIAAQARGTGVEINDQDIERMQKWLRTSPEEKINEGATNWAIYGRWDPGGP